MLERVIIVSLEYAYVTTGREGGIFQLQST
jgi:hypothetical protein